VAPLPLAPLTEPQELLHRQVHPEWINDGRVSSQAFHPTRKDAGKLSVSRGSLVSAKEAYLRHTRKEYRSAGTWSVSVGECSAVGVRAYADPIGKEDPRQLPEDDAHAVADFANVGGGSAVRKAADKLVSKARERGCMYAPPSGPPSTG